jgi:AcrR family transcriptional regulator
LVTAAARRNQILAAAAACFRRAGFRGASMADIAKAARMSPGHIYHYFENKEAIIEAVVDQCRWRGEIILAHVTSFDDVVQAILQVSVEWLRKWSGVAEPVLVLESFAEAARNPVIAGLFFDCDGALQTKLREILEKGQTQGVVDHRVDIALVCQLLTVALCGLVVHMAVHPDFDGADLDRMQGFITKALLSFAPDIWGGKVGESEDRLIHGK